MSSTVLKFVCLYLNIWEETSREETNRSWLEWAETSWSCLHVRFVVREQVGFVFVGVHIRLYGYFAFDFDQKVIEKGRNLSFCVKSDEKQCIPWLPATSLLPPHIPSLRPLPTTYTLISPPYLFTALPSCLLHPIVTMPFQALSAHHNCHFKPHPSLFPHPLLPPLLAPSQLCLPPLPAPHPLYPIPRFALFKNS